MRIAFIVHGFDANNKEIIETLDEQTFVTKLLAVERIQSVSEEYVLVNSLQGRVMYWEYEDTMQEIKKKLQGSNIAVA